MCLEYIKGLLDHAGSDVDLKDLIDQMRSDLQVPGLRNSLCKIMQDYNIQVNNNSSLFHLFHFSSQMSLSECCRKIIVHDCLSLRKQSVTLLQHGYLVRGKRDIHLEKSFQLIFSSLDTDVCAKCHNPVYTSGL